MEAFPDHLDFFSKYYYWQISLSYYSKGSRIMSASITSPSFNDNDKHNFIVSNDFTNAANFDTCDELVEYFDLYLKDIDYSVTLYVNLRTKDEKENYLLTRKDVPMRSWKACSIAFFDTIHYDKWGYGYNRIIYVN